MARVPIPVEDRVAGHRREDHAEHCEHQPQEGSRILEQEDGKLRASRLLDVSLPGTPAPLGLGVLDGRAQREALEHDRKTEDAERDLG